MNHDQQDAAGISNQVNAEPLLLEIWPTVGKLLGLSRSGSYAAAARGDFPTIKIGRLVKVPRKRFFKWLEGTDH